MKKKVLGIILIAILTVYLFTISVNALSFTASMTPSSTTVPESTEFMVTVKVSNLDVGANGINSLQGYLKYDTDVFEAITESNIEGLNKWSVKYDETTGKISLTKSVFVTSSQEVFQVSLKTKSGVSGKSGTVSYSNIVASNSENEINATDISTSIAVGTSNESNESTSNTSNTISISSNTSSNTANNTTVSIVSNTNSSNSISSRTNTTNSANSTNNTVNSSTNNTANNSAISSYTNSSVTNTNSDEKMPNTGVDDHIVKLMFLAIAIALGFYIKIEKLNKDMK